jgi:hypothetical protein
MSHSILTNSSTALPTTNTHFNTTKILGFCPRSESINFTEESNSRDADGHSATQKTSSRFTEPESSSPCSQERAKQRQTALSHPL